MTITAYGENAGTALNQAEERVTELEKLWSVTDENSEIYAVNHSSGASVSISDETAELLDYSLRISDLTNGALNCTMYPILTAWGFTTSNYQIPVETELSALLKNTGYEKVKIDGNSVSIPENMQIDLGAVEKGYTGDLIVDILHENDIESALLDLGGNIQTIGTKPDGTGWKLGLRSPFDEGSFATLEVSDCAVITSGGYERYFVGDDGETYWHILDPETGKPAHSGLVSVTIVGKEGRICDAVSTSLFVMGLDDTFVKQITNSFIVKIESGTIDLCFFTDFFYCDKLKIFLFKQFQKSFIHFHGSIKILAFGFIHSFHLVFYLSLISLASSTISKAYFFLPFSSIFL